MERGAPRCAESAEFTPAPERTLTAPGWGLGACGQESQRPGPQAGGLSAFPHPSGRQRGGSDLDPDLFPTAGYLGGQGLAA